MTSSQVAQVTPGQRCLLNLLERKLLKTAETYANKFKEAGKGVCYSELDRLKAKLKRISARQKRFTSEIINGNGNNTIPKESFFQALGLVTKEEFHKLNSKTNERRRRTTANPRFSHEAIQAKRALEPISKERRENTKRHNQNATSRANNNGRRTNNNNNNSKKATTTNNSNNNNNNNTTNSSTANTRNADAIAMLNSLLVERLNAKYNQIKVKKDNNQRLSKANETILNAINDLRAGAIRQPDNITTDGTATNTAATNSSNNLNNTTEPSDVEWIDMKCDESLDSLSLD